MISHPYLVRVDYKLTLPRIFAPTRRMQAPPTVLSQVTDTLFRAEFSRCVQKFPTMRPTRNFSEYEHFLALCFAQLTYRESLRDIVACLKSKGSALYHLGFRGRLSRSNLAYANRHRDWRMFQAVAEVLMRRAARLYQDCVSDPELPTVAFALDSSLIALSLNLFSWGSYNRFTRALKLHLMLSLQGKMPAWAAITEGRYPDMKILEKIPIFPGAYYVMDRGYLDFVRLFHMHTAGGFFVVRNKKRVRFRVLESREVDKSSGLRCDQTIQLTSDWSRKSYPEPLRRIGLYDAAKKLTLVLLTNQFDLPATLIAELYRNRWQVELFFKWIKQHLRIRSFYGRSENAVRCQIWSAICAYLMVAITRKQLNIGKSLNEILQIVSVSIFEQVPLKELLGTTQVPECQKTFEDENRNLLLFKDL